MLSAAGNMSYAGQVCRVLSPAHVEFEDPGPSLKRAENRSLIYPFPLVMFHPNPVRFPPRLLSLGGRAVNCSAQFGRDFVGLGVLLFSV